MKTLILLTLSTVLFASCSNDVCKVKTSEGIVVSASFNEFDSDLYNVGDSIIIRHTINGVIVTDRTMTYMADDCDEVAVITKLDK